MPNPIKNSDPVLMTSFAKKRDKVLKWNGWGYADSFFKLDHEGDVVMMGDRYEACGHKMPYFRPWFEEHLGVHDIINLRQGKFPRLPDLVVWPRSEQDVMK
ncbi:hypothetical protein OSTOST_22733, partial [Ostertagia ostertagi]